MKAKQHFRQAKALVVLVAVAALGLTACTSATPGGGASSSGQVVTLTLVSHYTDDTSPTKQTFDALIAQWNAANPGIQVVSQPVQFADLLTTLSTRQAGGQGADMFNAYAVWGQLASNGVLDTPPQAVIDDIKNNYNAPALAAVTGPDGQIFGYPSEVDTAGLFYNKQLMAAAGYPNPPTTWAQLQDAADKMTKMDKNGNYEVVGFPPTKTFDNDLNTAHPFEALWNASGAKSLTNPDGTSALDSNAQTLLQMYSDLVSSGAMSEAIDPYQAFPNGQIGMFIELQWYVSTLQSMMSAEDFSNIVGTAPIPGPNEGQVGSVSAVYYLGVSAASPHKAEAWQFLQWFNSVTNADGATTFGEDMANGGFIPPRTSDDQLLESQAVAQQPLLKPFWDASSYAMGESNTPNGYAAKTALHNGINDLVSNGTSASDTLGKINAAINASSTS